MVLGIDPKVDFAFKLMLGSPEHPAVTIHFLNAILEPDVLVVDVEILNPIQEKERTDGKLAVLDILAEDQLGRRFNVEMQTTLPAGLPQRLLYYNCCNYIKQIGEAGRYPDLRPAVSICVLDRVLFSNQPGYYHSFRLRCDQVELVLTDDFQFHTLELPKFEPPDEPSDCWSAREKWLYLLKNAESMAPGQLSDLLSEPAYSEAIGVLEMISKNPADLDLYEARLKFLRDEEAKLAGAIQQGREQGLEQGREQGLEEGELKGKVVLLRELLGKPPTIRDDVDDKSMADLAAMIDELQVEFRRRFT